MGTKLILSYNNDPELHVVPYDIARELKNYHILAVRSIFSCFCNKQNGVILNEDAGMNFPLQVVSFLSSFKEDTLGVYPILVITAEDNLELWEHYLREYVQFKFVSLSQFDAKSKKTRGLIVLGSGTELKKSVTIKETDFFMVIVEGLESVVNVRAIKGITGDFHIGYTQRNFYKEKDLKLMWQMLKWAEPNTIGKFADFTEEYNDCIQNMIEPFQEIWYRLTWNYSNTFEKPPAKDPKEKQIRVTSIRKELL